MEDSKIAHLLATVSAYAGLSMASFFLLVGITVAGVSANTSLPSDVQAAAVVLAQTDSIAPTLTSAASATLSGGFCPNLTQTLARGSRDINTSAQVSTLQNFLVSKGFMTSDEVTGYFGPITEAAIKSFQASKGVVSSGDPASTGWGRVGPLTRLAIMRACAGQQSSNTTANPDQTNTPTQTVTCSLGTVLVNGQCTAQQTLPPTPAASTTAPSAGFSLSSFVLTSNTPTITGTAYNVTNLQLTISNSQGKQYASGNIAIVGGAWSYKVTAGIPNGTYTLTLNGSTGRLAVGSIVVSGPGLADCSKTPTTCNQITSPTVDQFGNLLTAPQVSNSNGDVAAVNPAGAAPTVPTVVIQYPPGGELYDTSRTGHTGTRVLVQWYDYAIPAGSTACVYLVNDLTHVSYPLQAGTNCIPASPNQVGSNQGYPATPAGNYRAQVTILSSAGAIITSATGELFKMMDIDRQSQTVVATIDSGTNYITNTPTFTGSATVPKVQLTILSIPTSAGQLPETLYTSTLTAVSGGRWSFGPVPSLPTGAVRVALLDEPGNVIAYATVVVGGIAGVTTGQGSPTAAVLNVSPSSGPVSTGFTFTGSTGHGCDGVTYTLDYGDGSNVLVAMPLQSCNPVFVRAHAYSAPGIYTAKIIPPTTCTAGSACAAAAPVVTATVTITGSTSYVGSNDLMAAAVNAASFPFQVMTDSLGNILYSLGLY